MRWVCGGAAILLVLGLLALLGWAVLAKWLVVVLTVGDVFKFILLALALIALILFFVLSHDEEAKSRR